LALEMAPAGARATAPIAPIVGQWRSVDEDTGRSKAVIEITATQGGLEGRIVKTYGRGDRRCSEACPGHRAGAPIQGLQILWGFEEPDEDGRWRGFLLDPRDGEVHEAAIWRDGDAIRVRGYLGIFYSTRTWYPADGADQYADADESDRTGAIRLR
jgi:uncharacterized protein (DUF2147 family)